MRRLPTLILLVSMAALVGCDRGPSPELRAQDRYALELANCAAYYAVMSDCLAGSAVAQKGNVAQTRAVAVKAMRMSVELTSQDATRERITRATDRINETLQNECVNPELVVQEYGEACALAVDDPEGRAAHWLEAVEK